MRKLVDNVGIQDSKIITVTGNYGKSIFSYFLAQALSRQKIQRDEYHSDNLKVAILSTDDKQPMVDLMFPTAKTDKSKSLGRVLSMAALSVSDLFNNAYVINDNIMWLGYAPNETKKTYPDITEINLSNLHDLLNKIVDVIIVDTATERNVIDYYFLARSRNICITTADLKGVNYRRIYMPQENDTQLLVCNSRYAALPDILGTFDTPPQILPYCKVFSAVYNGINISDIIPPKKYTKFLDKLVISFVGEISEKGV